MDETEKIEVYLDGYNDGYIQAVEDMIKILKTEKKDA